MTPVKREPKRRGSKNLPPHLLYDTLCGIFPAEIADRKFRDLMGYAPPQEWRKPETPLHIFSEDEKHGTTD